MHSPVRRIAESFGSPQNQMHEMKNLHDRRRFLKSILKWLELWGLLFCGHLLAGLIFTKAGASCTLSFIDVLIMAIPLSALVVAATGPLAIVGFALFLFRVQGGTPVAVFSLTFGSLLIYSALIWCTWLWAKAGHAAARWCAGICLLCYSAFATFCMLYLASSM